ncbi:protein repA [Aerococcus viridans]
MSEKEKKKNITLSVTEDTDKVITDLSKKYGMTKSGLITFLVQQANEKGIFR